MKYQASKWHGQGSDELPPRPRPHKKGTVQSQNRFILLSHFPRPPVSGRSAARGVSGDGGDAPSADAGISKRSRWAPPISAGPGRRVRGVDGTAGCMSR